MNIFVLGAGTMGAGIAQVAATAGHTVYLRDIREDLVENGWKHISDALARWAAKGKLTPAEADAILSRIHKTTNMELAGQADLVIEAAVEAEALKKDIFNELDKLVEPETILASNTSSISITAIASATAHPERVIGMHFFNPAPVMGLVEVIRGIHTSDAVCRTVTDLAAGMGKKPVLVREAAGFIVNRILIPMVNEAIVMLTEGVASAEDIDTAMKLGANHPMGPLALADLIGLDVCLAIMEMLHKELGEDKYRPAPLLRKMVAAKLLGRKSGCGFYPYNRG